MDTFPRPDVAEGIFYEYLRNDDPISVDFLNNVVEGFPFLLAPLSQVKGVTPGMMSSPALEGQHEGPALLRAVGGFADMLTLQTENLGEWIHDSANAMAKGMTNVAQSAGDTARNIGEEMDRRREMLWRQVSSMPESVASRIQPSRRALSTMPSWMKGMGGNASADDFSEGEDKLRKPGAPRGRAFGSPLTRWLGESQEATLPDEIGPMIHPTMNFTRKVFLAMVHMYLMLLLIVSLPGSPNTRTKLVVRRKSRGRKGTVQSTGMRLPKGGNPDANKGEKRIETKSSECQGKIKKSLSYFL